MPASMSRMTDTRSCPPVRASMSRAVENIASSGNRCKALSIQVRVVRMHSPTIRSEAQIAPESNPFFRSVISITHTPVSVWPSMIACCIGAGPR